MNDENNENGNKNNTNKPINAINNNYKGIIPIKISVKMFINSLCKRVNTSLYYNKNCYTQLKPDELKSVPKLLLYLYGKREKFGKKIKGIQTKVIVAECGLSKPAITLWLARFTPTLINMNFYKKGKGYISRYYYLNENGIVVCKKLLEKR